MTNEEFKKIRPGKTILNVRTDEGEKKMLVKFFTCDTNDFDGYWMCCTEDLSNPYPTETRKEDWEVYSDNAEIIEL